ncbi:MAG: YigZ family protein [Anaerolineae bacterium]|nr:YigZ family protein [Anaerolineae bacterium]
MTASEPERLVPAAECSAEIIVVNSRFIASAAPAFTVEEARAFIARIRERYSDASHNVPVFLVGHGASVTAHCSDDGEPSGTAGRPALAVLQGSGLGDVALVVTRYFGGTKLGTGGLVRAYGDAVRALLLVLPRARKVATQTLVFELPYPLYERAKLWIEEFHGELLDQEFTADVLLTARFERPQAQAFTAALFERSQGTIEAQVLEENENDLFPVIEEQ